MRGANKVANTGAFEPKVIIATGIIALGWCIRINHEGCGSGSGSGSRGLDSRPLLGYLFGGEKLLLTESTVALHGDIRTEIPHAL